MNNLPEHLNKAKASVQFGYSRKAFVRDQLVSYMEQHPTVALPAKDNFMGSLRYAFSTFALRPMPVVLAAIALVIVGGAGTALAAEKSLPGQRLYGWKVNVNEPVQLALIHDQNQKAEFEMTLAARSLNEAQELARANQLDAIAQAEVQTNFQKHATHIQARVDSLEADNRKEDAASLREKFRSTISAQQKHLLNLSTNGKDSDKDKDKHHSDQNDETTVNSQINATDNAILSSQVLLHLNDKDNKSKKRGDIDQARKLLDQARVQLKSGNHEDAWKLNQEAIQANEKINQDELNEHY